MIEKLAGHLLGIDIDTEEGWNSLEKALYVTYGIELHEFEKLVHNLLPLCEVGQDPLTGKLYRGFADTKDKIWLMKKEVDND